MAIEFEYELPDGWVSERGLPTTVGEVVAAIFVRSAWRLHHALKGKECLYGELHVNINGSLISKFQSEIAPPANLVNETKSILKNSGVLKQRSSVLSPDET